MNNVPVLPRDHYLSSMLPETNSLDQYHIVKTHFSSTATEIYKSVHEAVTLESVNPQKIAMHCFN